MREDSKDLTFFFFSHAVRAQWIVTVWQVVELRSHPPSEGGGLDSQEVGESGDLQRWVE